jgi:signal transduction histidine kinase/ActR/RegA family two-component response regulator
MPRKALSLQVTLGIALSALILLLALALAAGLGAIAMREVSGMAAGNIETLAQQMARELSQGMDDFARDVEAEAERAPLREPQARTEDLRGALEAFIAAHPDISYAGLADADGRIVAATSTLFEGGDLRGRALFEEGRKGLYFGDVHDAARLAELLPKPFNGEPARFIDVSAPVRDAKGNLVRVLFAHIGWQWASSLRDAVLGPMKDRRGIELLIADGAGKLVLAAGNTLASGAPLASLAAKPPGAAGRTIAWIDGDWLTAQADTLPQGEFPGFGWKVVSRQPAAIAAAPATTLRRAFFAGALALGLVAAMLAWLLTARMLRPVQRLASSAMLLAPREVAAAPVARRRGDEIAQVQGVLQRLASEGKSLSNAASLREMQFITLAESLPHIVWQADAGGVIEYRNAQWSEVFGRARINRLDQLSALIHQADLLTFMNAWNGSRISGEALHCTVRMAVDGNHEWFSIDGRALRDEERRPVRWVGTITNVNDSLSQAEHSAMALAQERAARQEAERHARSKEDFLALLSHELRTPLNAIAGWAELLARRGPQDGMTARAAGVINRNVQLQAALLDDLQDNSAVVGGSIALTPARFDVSATARSVALSNRPAAEEKGIALECEPGAPAFIEADERRIHQALSCLVSNAIKFTDAGGRITLRTAHEGDMVAIDVADTGCGLASDALPKLFERLRQEPVQAGRDGAGMGLAIAASLARLHGGSIDAKSAGIGKGAVFTIRLPALPEAGSEGDSEAVRDDTGTLLLRYPMTPLAGMKILVVDDEEDARQAAKALLESFGAKVALAASAQETLQTLDRRHVDLLICDIGMPGVDGFEMMRTIRKRARDKGALTPAIALTAHATERDQRAAWQAGFDGYVAKPLSAQTLIETICTVCEVDGQA